MTTADEVRQLYETLLEAWNKRDAVGMAALFGRRGTSVGFDGSVANGAEEIETHLTPIFVDHPTPRYVSKIREIRELGSATALLRAVAGMIPPGKTDINPDANAIQTLVASRDSSGRWRVEIFQNTPAAFHGRPEEREKLSSELRAVAALSSST